MMEERKMKTNTEEIEIILKEILDGTNHSKSNFSISPYGSRGKQYLYLYRIKKKMEGCKNGNN